MIYTASSTDLAAALPRLDTRSSSHSVRDVPRSIDRDTPSSHCRLLDVIAVDAISLQAVGSLLAVAVRSAIGVGLWVDTEISSIDIGFLALVAWESRLDVLLVLSENRLELGGWDVVKEDAFTEFTVGDGESLLAVSGFSDISKGIDSEGSEQ